MRVASRFSGPGLPYEGLARDGKWTGEVRLVEDHLADPLRWRKPRRIFVNSMSDLFHERVPDEWIDRVFAVMSLAPQHSFQILTKRPERMWAYLSEVTREPAVRVVASNVQMMIRRREMAWATGWPIPNVWIGVSVEDQATADARVPVLLSTPAAVRFVSYEPALGPVDWTAIHAEDLWTNHSCGIDWIICGGESGPGARPFDVAWARQTIAQCRDAGVACFVKQLGARPFSQPVYAADGTIAGGVVMDLRHRAGADPDEWPEDLRVREFPGVPRG